MKKESIYKLIQKGYDLNVPRWNLDVEDFKYDLRQDGYFEMANKIAQIQFDNTYPSLDLIKERPCSMRQLVQKVYAPIFAKEFPDKMMTENMYDQLVYLLEKLIQLVNQQE